MPKPDNSFEAPPETAVEVRAASAKAWRRRNGALFYRCGGAWLLVSLLLTSLLPNSWDHNSEALSVFTTAMMTIVPSIEKFAAVSSFKGVTEAYLAITWALVFVTVGGLTLRSWPLDIRSRIPVTNRWVVFWLLALLFVAVSIGQFIGFRITPRSISGYSFAAIVLRSISSSRSGLALYGTALYAVQSILITSVIVVGRNFRRLWLTSHYAYPNN